MTQKTIYLTIIMMCLCSCHAQKPNKNESIFNKPRSSRGEAVERGLRLAQIAEKNQDHQRALTLYSETVNIMTENQRLAPKHQIIIKKVIPNLRAKAKIMSGVLGLVHFYISQFEEKDQYEPFLSLTRIYKRTHQYDRAFEMLSMLKRINKSQALEEGEHLNEVYLAISNLQKQYHSKCLLVPWLCPAWPSVQRQFAAYPFVSFGLTNEDEDSTLILEMFLFNKRIQDAQLYILSQEEDEMMSLGIDGISYGIEHEQFELSKRIVVMLSTRIQLMAPDIRQDYLHELYEELIYDKALATQRTQIFQQIISNIKNLDKDEQLDATIRMVKEARGNEDKTTVFQQLDSINLTDNMIRDTRSGELLSVATWCENKDAAKILYEQIQNKERQMSSIVEYIQFAAKHGQTIEPSDIQQLQPLSQQLIWSWAAVIYLQNGYTTKALAVASNIDGTLHPGHYHQYSTQALFKGLLDTLRTLKLKKTHTKQVDTLITYIKKERLNKTSAMQALMDHALAHKNQTLYKRTYESIKTLIINDVWWLERFRSLVPIMLKYNKRKDLFAILTLPHIPPKMLRSVLGKLFQTLNKSKSKHPKWMRDALVQMARYMEHNFNHFLLRDALNICHPKKYDCIKTVEQQIAKMLTKTYLNHRQYTRILTNMGHYDLAILQMQKIAPNYRSFIQEELVDHWIKTPKMQKAKPQFLAQTTQRMQRADKKTRDFFYIALWESYIESGQCSKLKSLPARDAFFDFHNDLDQHMFVLPCLLQNEHAFVLDMLINHVKDTDFQLDRLLMIGAYFDGNGLSQTPAIQKLLQQVIRSKTN